jgi:alpha-1,3-rhamnosyl/mannosyltransferase
MQSGVPVVCPDRASLPEVAGGAALLKHPDDLEGLAEAFLLVLDGKEEREYLISAAIQQAKRFNWEHCALETVGVFQNVLCKWDSK